MGESAIQRWAHIVLRTGHHENKSPGIYTACTELVQVHMATQRAALVGKATALWEHEHRECGDVGSDANGVR